LISTQTIGYYCLVAGLSMIAGWWIAFRNRPYLLSLGIFFAALAAALIIGDRMVPGVDAPGLRWALRGAVAAAAVAFVIAVVLATQETRRRIREMREHYRAAAEALAEMARAKEQQLRDKHEQDTSEGDKEP
jgi:prepilin signal peptidase PulO-like enzyme (type II secretory pathway)